MTDVHLDAALIGALHVAVVEAEEVTVREHDPAVWAEIEALAARLRRAYEGAEPAEIEGLRPARELYRRTGVDPTKLRPSSEALLRRVLRGGALPRINSFVDATNLCSLDFLLPIGLHDLDRLKGDITLRLGETGEGYEAIGKAWYSVEGRLTASDAQGACGSPTSDSRRTMITLETRRGLMLVYAPASYAPARLEAHAAVAAERIRRYLGGRIVQARVV
jgi:DNA/RNA-binding domain of Phe-tRNA-synthetase-like protein